MTDYFPPSENEVSPFCPATGKMVWFCKGAKAQPTPPPAAARAADNPTLIGQASEDEDSKDQMRRKRNNTVIGASSDTSFGNKMTLG